MSEECNECSNPCGHNLGCPIWHAETLGEIERLRAENERLQRNLNTRDDFLGRIGQWEAFVASLPR